MLLKTGKFEIFAISCMLTVGSSFLSVVIWGFCFGISNNEFHSIIVNKIAGGVTFNGDALAATMKNYASPFWLVVGVICRVFPQEKVFFLIFLIGRVLLNICLAVAIFSLSKHKNWIHSIVLASIVTISSGFVKGLPLGADPVMENYLSQTPLSTSLCILSFAFCMLRKDILSAIILGFAYNINVIQANFTIGILASIWLFRLREDRGFTISKTFVLLVIATAIAIPTLYLVISGILTETSENYMSGFELSQFAKYIYPHHFFWSMKGIGAKTNGISLFFVPLTLIVTNMNSAEKASDIIGKKEVLLATTLLFLYTIVGAVAAEIFPSRTVFQLHLFRCDTIGFLLSLSILLAVSLDALQRESYERCVVLFLALAALLNHQFLVAVGILLLWEVHMRIGMQRNVIGHTFEITANILMFASLIYLFLYGKEKYFITMCVVVLLFNARRFSIPFIACLICIGLYVTLISYIHYSERKYRMPEGRVNNEMQLLAADVASKVNGNSLFVIPPNYMIRSFLKHGVYLSMKDGSAYLWSKGYEREFLRRLGVLGIDYVPGKQFRSEDIERRFLDNVRNGLVLLKGEGVTHLILPVKVLPREPDRFVERSKNFVVLDINSALSNFGCN